MRKTWIALAAVVALGLGGLVLVSQQPGGLSLGSLDLGQTDRAFLKDTSISFLEDLKYKDFKKAATYHLAKTQKERDIPSMIQRIFFIKHELLDITAYKVLDVDFDRSKTRARARVQVNYAVLGDRVPREDERATRDLEMLLYYFKQPDGEWTMELESSIR